MYGGINIRDTFTTHCCVCYQHLWLYANLFFNLVIKHMLLGGFTVVVLGGFTVTIVLMSNL